MNPRRRRLLTALGALTLAGGCVAPARTTRAPDLRLLVIGGGFAGATAARYLARWVPGAEITLVTSPRRYWTCPFSNTAVAGLRSVDALEIDYAGLARTPDLRLIRQDVVELDPVALRARCADGTVLEADRIVVAPGIDLDGSEIDGYDAGVTERFPHAWEAGPATLALRRRLEAVPDGGLVVVTAPENPYRCPPGPYERASLIAWWLHRHRPGARVVILDAKDAFTKDALFHRAWSLRYPQLEWIGRSDGGSLRAVDPERGSVHTDFDDWEPDLACVIPSQKAARIARDAGLDGGLGWCEVRPDTFESRVCPGVHVIGDAAVANPMPKSAFAANSQAKACAGAIAHLVTGAAPPQPILMNTCYSLVAPDAAISIAGSYGVVDGRLQTLPGTSGVSPADAPGARTDADLSALRIVEAAHAHGWYASIVADAFA